MQNLYEQIDSNKRRSVLIVSLFIAFFSAFGYALAYVYGYDWSFFVIAIIFSSVGSIISYYHSDTIVLKLAQAEPANRQQHRRYFQLAENLAHIAQIPQPKLYIIPSPALNAFATGRDPQHSAIAVTQGLLDNLTRTELEGVLAHEFSHIKNYDTRLMTLVSILVGSISIILNWIWRLNLRNDRDRDNNSNPIMLAIGIIMIILAPIIAQLIQLAISRRREFYADASAVLFTRQPSGLISALKKIDRMKIPLNQATPATAPLYISNPVHDQATERWLGKLFSTHPPINERIQALEGKKT